MNRKHQPFHLCLNNEIYFITCRTHDKVDSFKDDRDKEILINIILKIKQELGFSLYAFAIANNHYHILIGNKANEISKIIKKINGNCSFLINSKQGLRGRRVWQNYWDWCIRSEGDFYTHFNYIHNNPIKHGLVKNFEELKNYKYCSYKYWAEKEGAEFLLDCFASYPVIDYQKDD